MSQIENLTFQVTSPEELSRVRVELGLLVRRSIRGDFPSRPTEETLYFAERAKEIRENPNRAVGGVLLRPGQRYARPLSVLAFRGRDLVAHLPVADNASTRRRGLPAAVELTRKLYSPDTGALTHRYAWLGYAAMTKELGDAIRQEPKALNPLDVMVYLAVKTRDSRQPVTSYPWRSISGEEGEFALEAALECMGLEPQPGQTEEIRAFGRDSEPVQQTRWLGHSLAGVLSNIVEKQPDAEAVLEDIRVRL